MKTNVTRPGKAKPTGSQTYGEDGNVGSRYTAVLEQRQNMANTRNLGPTGSMSSVGTIPVVTQNVRKTGRVA